MLRSGSQELVTLKVLDIGLVSSHIPSGEEGVDTVDEEPENASMAAESATVELAVLSDEVGSENADSGDKEAIGVELATSTCVGAWLDG